MTMTNEHLKQNLADLAQRVQGQADRLEEYMPEIRDKVQQGEARYNVTADQLRDLVNPMLQTDLISRIKALNGKTDLLNGIIITVNQHLSECPIFM